MLKETPVTDPNFPFRSDDELTWAIEDFYEHLTINELPVPSPLQDLMLIPLQMAMDKASYSFSREEYETLPKELRYQIAEYFFTSTHAETAVDRG